jgi:hypothetical protein
MLELLIAILLATGCPVPPNLPTTGTGSTISTFDDGGGDTGGDEGHLPPPKPPTGTIGGL